MTEPERPDPDGQRALPRWSLVALCLPTAALLEYAAAVLPWQRMTAFSIGTVVLSVVHLVVAVLAAIRSPRLRRALRLLGFASLFYLAWIAQQVFGSALYVAEIYGSLGKGVAAGMGAFVGLTAMLTLPIGLWALSLSAATQRPRTLWGWLLGAAVLFGGLSIATWAQARAPELAAGNDLAGRVRDALPNWAELPDAPAAVALFAPAPVPCESVPGPGKATAAVFHTDRKGELRAVCLQAEASALPERIADELRAHAVRGPVKIDWVTKAHALSPHPGLLGPLVDVLSLRPGLDGACHAGERGTRCLMPWQMVATSLFAAREATPYIPKMRLGFAVEPLRRALGAEVRAEVDGLTRIATESLLVDANGELTRLRRLKPLDVEVNAAAVERAEQAAESHAVRALRGDGTFRYQLDAFSGDVVEDNPSIPRHAGMTLVLCELGRDVRSVNDTIERALDAQSRYARHFDDRAALTYRRKHRVADLGSSALGLVAFTACRARAGDDHDALIGKLARFLMALQRPDGSFRPGRHLRRGEDLDGPTPMFAAGQAVMALTQLEEIMQALPPEQHAPFPPLPEVHDAVERAMDHTAGAYWPSPLREFFFLKENWHCLAARAALRSHRHDGYERFCIDYADFKSRLLLGPGDDVDRELEGGYGFGNIVPPHTGSSGGLGEAIGAAIALRKARGEDASAQQARLKRILEFLLRQQARPETCFACTSEHAAGWFSGFMVAPWGRIDHIQHPWSALGHGARALGWRAKRDAS